MKFTKTLIAVAAIAAASAASAQSWTLQYGESHNYNRTTLGYNFATRDLGSIGQQKFFWYPEVAVSYWNQAGEGLWQLSAVPMVRTYLGTSRLYVEGGIGASVFDDTQFAGRTMSTAFQFTSQAGVGFQQTDRLGYSIRYSHSSNAGIKKPNDGLDLVSAVVTYKF